MQIAVNAYIPATNAYKIVVCVEERNCYIRSDENRIYCQTQTDYNHHSCAGVYNSRTGCYGAGKFQDIDSNECPSYCLNSPVIPNCEEAAQLGECGSIGTVHDLRTAAMITDGCCPAALL